MAQRLNEHAMLLILLATCENALEVFAAAAKPVDVQLVEDLEKVAARVRREIDSYARHHSADGD